MSAVMLTLLACTGGESPTDPNSEDPGFEQIPTEIQVSTSSLTFAAVGDTIRLTATVVDQTGAAISDSAITWSSSDDSVITVSDGLITAIGNGTATVTVSSGTLSLSASVTVSQVAASAALSQDTVIFSSLGDTLSVAASVTDARGNEVEGATITWASSDETVATTVDGLITAVGNGTAMVTATLGAVSVSAAVTVSQSAASVTLSPDTVFFSSLGDTLSVTPSVADQRGNVIERATVTWSTSDESVATTVDGLMTAVGNGTATVSATLGAISASANVTVSQSATSVTISPSTTLFSSLGDTLTLAATVADANGATIFDASVTWASSDEAVSTVTDGLVVAVANGAATIRAMSGTAAGSVPVTVTQVASTVVLTPEPSGLIVGGTQTLAASVRDMRGNEISGAIVDWSSDNSAIATVTAGGLVTGISTGQVLVTAVFEAAQGRAAIAVTEALAFETDALPNGVVGSPYSGLLEASGTQGATTWLVSTGSLPDGLTMDESSGAISGIPISTGTSAFTVQVESAGQTATRSLSITIFSTLAVTTASLADGIPGVAYSESLSAAGGTGTFTWSISAGALPDGLTLNAATGEIAGSPTSQGSSTFTATASSGGSSASRQLTIEVMAPLTISTSSLPGGLAGLDYGSRSLLASGGTGTYTWALAGGSGPLPTGLVLSDLGVVTGTPTTVGDYPFVAQVSSGAETTTAPLTISISEGVSITLASLANAIVGTPYTETLTALGSGTLTWGVTAGTLPTGLTLDQASGVISGTPTVAATSDITVEVRSGTDAASKGLSLSVYDPLIVATTSLPGGFSGSDYGAQPLTATGGDGVYDWSVSGGSMPAGLTLSADGAVTGTPAAVETANFTVRVTSGQQLTEQALSIVVSAPLFTLATNGVTVVCSPASVGDVGSVGGIMYTKRDRAGLDELITRDEVVELATTCTSDIPDMSGLFEGQATFNENISRWDVSSVSDMSLMFRGATSFNQSLAEWDVSLVQNMRWMFTEASSFDQPIGNWNVGSVTDMNDMFASASAFNQELGNWDVQQVTTMDGMFRLAAQFNQDLSAWCVTSIATEPTDFDTSAGAWLLPTPSWGSCSSASTATSAITAGQSTIPADGKSTTSLSLQLKDPSGTNLSESAGALSFVAPSEGSVGSIVDNGNGAYTAVYTAGTSAGTVTLTPQLDGGLKALPSIDIELSPFLLAENGITVTCTDAAVGESGELGGVTYTKRDRVSLTSLVAAGVASDDFSALATSCTSGVTDFSELIRSARTFNEDIGSWDVTGASTMKRMFMNAQVFNQDIGSWDVSSVQDMECMFCQANDFNQDIGRWDVGAVTNMYGMFTDAFAFNQDIGIWDMSRVTNVEWMFESATSFDQDIGGWDTGSITQMTGMFLLAASFNRDLSSWNVSEVQSMRYMFESATAFNQDLSRWCVGRLPSEPLSFDRDASSWTLADSRPFWGTCPISLSASFLTGGNVGSVYSAAPTPATSAVGGGAVSYSISAGSLPAGLNLNGADGTVSGTPSAPGAAFFEIQAANTYSSSTAQFSVTVSESAATGFNMWAINVAPSLPADLVSRALNRALTRWEQTVTGDAVGRAASPVDPTWCGGAGDLISNQQIDDVLVLVDIAPIDGPGTILGQAGPCIISRVAPYFTKVGRLTLDEADLLAYSEDDLTAVLWHEIGHIMGVGSQWQDNGLISTTSGPDPRYLGPLANAEYDALLGSLGNTIPVEADFGPGSAYGHWDEVEFGIELMTPALNSGVLNPISRMTIAGLADLGWRVSYDRADAYTLPATALVLSVSEALAGWERVPDWPVHLDPSGNDE